MDSLADDIDRVHGLLKLALEALEPYAGTGAARATVPALVTAQGELVRIAGTVRFQKNPTTGVIDLTGGGATGSGATGSGATGGGGADVADSQETQAYDEDGMMMTPRHSGSPAEWAAFAKELREYEENYVTEDTQPMPPVAPTIPGGRYVFEAWSRGN